jgi:hypothetical protein
MKTDDLVATLSAHVEPVNRKIVTWTVYIALVAGTVLALGIMLAGLGVRSDLMTARALMFLLLKLAFTIGIVGVASVYLTRLARPGGGRTSSISAAMPFAAIVLLSAISLGVAPSSHWNRMVMGDEWLECLLSIPVIAILPFAVIVAAVRRAAPTNLVRTGAVVGLIAGGVSAMAYALHCTDDSLPFVAVWYGGTIVLCTLAGAALGPRLLRW